jgi:predicted Zn finger-like uncharacterized protein
MRLTCPNCQAQYEVADSVVPTGGRDVQCSACGNVWFQYPADVALRMRAADLDDDDDDDDLSGAAAPKPAAPEKRIDKTVLDVLRQEAERELAERKQARPGVETQAELGLVSRPPARAGDAPRPREAAVGSRRSLLPDVESISPEIETANAERAARSAAEAARAAEDPASRSGREFRRGLAYVLLAFGVLIGLYLMAPMLAEWVPALAGPLAGYVTMVDSLRLAVARLLGGS